MATLGVSSRIQGIGPTASPDISSSNFFVVIASPWGLDNTWQAINSFADFVRLYGGLNKLVTVGAGVSADTWSIETNANVVQPYYAVSAYFSEKGRGAPGALYVCRVVKSAAGATAASKTFPDGGANNTTVTAKWKGASGNTILVTVTNPSPVKGTGYAQFVCEFPQAGIVETWEIATAADAANATRKSQIVKITLPAGLQLPITAAKSKLNSGTPGTADAYDASDNDYVGTVNADGSSTGLQVFGDFKLGGGFVAIPGKYSSTIRTGIGTHVASYWRMGLLGSPSGLNVTTVQTDLGTSSDQYGRLEYYWPQLHMSDVGGDSGGTLLVDNVGHVAGLSARMDKEYGDVHKSPAGLLHPLVSAVDVERNTSTQMELGQDADANTLADKFINMFRVKNNSIVGWGLRTLATDNRYRQSNVARNVCKTVVDLQQLLEKYAFEPVDPQGNLFASIRGDVNAYFETRRLAGAFYGNKPGGSARPDDAYFCTCSTENNPGILLSAGEIHVDVQFVPSPNSEKVSLTLSPTTAGFIGKTQ